VARAHQHAAGAGDKGAAQALGRSRPGCGTRAHAAVSGPALSAKLVLTPGQAAGSKQAAALLGEVPFGAVIAD
jgi:hypothetical protein